MLIDKIKILVYLNFWIAAGAFFQSWFATLYFRSEEHFNYPAVLFFSTLFLYNFQRYIKNMQLTKGDLSDRHLWLRKHFTALKAVSGIAFAGLLIFLTRSNSSTIIALGFCGVIGVLYAGIFRKKAVGLREIPGLKVWLIAGTWAVVCVAIPGMQSDFSIVFHPAFRVFLLILSLGILFDLRDIHFDPQRLKTIPQRIGKSKSIALSIGLLFAMTIHSFVCMPFPFFIADGITTTIGSVLIIGLYNKEKELMYGFGIDGLIVLHGALNLLLVSAFA